MKKYVFKFNSIFSLSFLLHFTIAFFLCLVSKTQVATYTLTSGSGGSGIANVTGTSVNVNAGTLISGSQMITSSWYNSSGYRTKTNSLDWPIAFTNGFGFDIPLSPKNGFDFSLTGITASINSQSYNTSSTILFIDAYYQINGNGNWRKLNGASGVSVPETPTSGLTVNFGSVNDKFYSGNSYVFRFFVYASAVSDKNDNFRISDLVFNGTVTSPPAIAPQVTTASASSITKYTATVAGTYTIGNTIRNALQSGIAWSTNVNPTVLLQTITTNGSGGLINSILMGLNAGTTYFARAYCITQIDTIYGNQQNFTTLPPSVPSITTNAISNVLSTKATSGGNNIDSGGYTILEKGICWATSNNPTTANFKNTEGVGNNNFISIMNNLLPNTTYFVKAYARNQLGTGYGDEQTFTTGPVVPSLTATPLQLDFGNVSYNSSQPVLSYLLSGNNLTPSAGSISVQAPIGYEVSIQANTNFAANTNISYTGGNFNNKRIYVRLKTNFYGTFNNSISHSGGGTIPINTDSVLLKSKIVQDPAVLTNSGTEFWLGNGYQERNDRRSGDANEGKLSIYIAAGDQPAIVNVELPAILGAVGFPRNGITIPANTVIEVKDFPTGSTTNNMNPTGLPDSRLFYTGKSKRGIKVTSTNGTPISVWMHTYAPNNSAAAAMVFPTNTWNSSYTVQAYGGKPTDVPYVGGFSNNSNPNSFFFVIANDDNTPIWFTPSQDILDSIPSAIFSVGHTAAMVKYQKGITYGPILLNKGEIFNAMGYIQGSGNSANGLDLTGTKVWTNCDKTIAVFGGNGRCLVNAPNCNASSGSDHMIQQMFPKVAWGTKYITVPTKTMEYNIFRITVDDPTTLVWVNDPNRTAPITGLINNLYYQINNSISNLIESDKPINVTQFITAGGCANANGSKGNGDPEMIILSPIQQAINKATVYSAPIKNPSATYNGHYINVVIRKEGIASFRLNNLTTADTGINQISANNTTCYNTGGTISITNAFVKQPYDTNYYFAKFKVSPNSSNTLSADYPFNAVAYGMGDGESYGYNAGTTIKNLSAIIVAENPFGTDTSTTVIRTCLNNPVRLKIALPYLVNTVDSILWNAGNDPTISPNGIIRGPLTQNPSNPSNFYATFDGTTIVDGRTYYLYSSPQQYVFSQEGTFQIKVIAKGTFVSECGSESTHIINVTVGHDDIAFTANPGACGSTAVTFTDNSQPLFGTTIKQWQWTFGDGQSSTSLPPNPNPIPNPHVYPPQSSGITSYWAKLKTINSVGCFSQDSVFIDLAFNLKANFVASRDTICKGTSVIFNDLSTSNAVEWIWVWNDATPNTVITGTSPTVPVAHTFNTPGTFNVQLFIKNAAGCTSLAKDTNIVVIDNPIADFQTPIGICLGGSLQFTNLSTPVTGVSYLWNFNDLNSTVTNPNTSTLQNPTHIYTSNGPFNVTLIVTNNRYGCTDTKTKTLSSTIYQLPIAAINVPNSICLRDTTYFIDASTAGSGNTLTQWNWSFGDGGTSTLQNPKHPYFVLGNQTVTLTVTNDKGCVSSPTSTIINVKPLPNVVFAALPNLCLNAATINITQATETTGVIGTMIYSGSGVSGSIFNPFIAGVGSFPIIATFTANNGCKHDDTSNITVMPLPIVDITVVGATCEKTTISFTDNSTSNGGSLSNWVWNFGDASTNSTTNPTTHTYQNTGNYNVTLTVTNGNNCTATGSKSITIRNQPIANFSLPSSVCLPNGSATFINLSTVADDPNPTYNWDFGNPNNTTGSTLPNPTHSYSTTGPFTIKLSVKSLYNCTKDTTKILTNIFAEPVASFIANPSEICLKDTIKFISSSSTIPTRWSWNFDNGATDTIANPVYSYNNNGNYNVSFYFIDVNGCKSNTAFNRVIVNPYPFVDAGTNKWILQGGTIPLNASVTGIGLSYLWTPSIYLDYDTVLVPKCTPLTDQLYTLKVTGVGGCSSTDTTRVLLLKTPIIPNAFTPNGDRINDTWEITYLNNYIGCTVDVFNRNGQIVYTSAGYSKEWDGTINGKPLPVGTYYYIINPKSGHRVLSGSVTIIR